MNSFIIKGDICHSDDRRNLLTFEDSYAVCEGGICRGVFREIPEKFKGLPVYDHSGMLVMPGMVDLHTDAPQFAYRGLGMDH